MRSKLLLALSCLFMLQMPVFAESYQVRVTSVIDGDTLLVSRNGQKEKVILYGVDCPEALK